MTAFGGLARYARRPAREPEERCELCSAPVGPAHRHVVDLERRTICCACRPCAILFEKPGSGSGKWRTIPDRVRLDPELHLTAGAWAALGVPVRLAFLLRSGERWTAFYPGPGGVTEAPIDEELFAPFRRLTRLADEVEEDVEALLVQGERGAPELDCLLVPVDACYELAGRVRRSWEGFDGGDTVRREIADFLEGLRARARPLP